MRRKRLRPKEIEEKLEELRSSYAAFITEYKKPNHLLTAFNERYFEILRNRMDLSGFFEAETAALEDLKSREINDRKALQEKARKKNQLQRKRRDTAQRIWEENQQHIFQYPCFGIHPEASADVDRLLGAMAAYRKERWPRLEWVFRSLAPGREGDTRVALEMHWRDFCVPGVDEVPPRIWKYRSLLSRLPRKEETIEWEERQIIFECARFLGLLRNTVGELLNDNTLLEKEKQEILQEQEALETILADFRLFDLLRLDP